MWGGFWAQNINTVSPLGKLCQFKWDKICGKRFSIPVGTPAYDAVHNYVSVRTGFKSPYFFLECDATKCFLRDRRMPVKAVRMILQRMAVTVGTNPAGYRLSDLRMMSMTRRPY